MLNFCFIKSEAKIILAIFLEKVKSQPNILIKFILIKK